METTRTANSSTRRVPPHNLQAEESLLGAMLLSQSAVATALEFVSSGDFYKPIHAHVFDAMHAIYVSGRAIDTVTVAEELNRNDVLEMVGGEASLLEMQARTPAISNAERYAKIVQEHALLRRLIGAAGEIAEIGYSLPDDVIKAVDEAESMIFAIAENRQADTMAPLGELLNLNLDRLERLYEKGDAITGTPTGYRDLDKLLSGLQPSSLVVVGARPAMGKTSFALGMASHAALKAKKSVLFFSLEMGHIEITQRLLNTEAGLDSEKTRNGQLNPEDWTRITRAMGRLGDARLWIDDDPMLTVMEIRAKARRLKAQIGDLGLIVVDYLQLMTGGSRGRFENRQVEISEISRGLKVLARELETPVVALSQLSRGLESRTDKRPMLSDLRESGSIEQDADVVMFLYRDEMYNDSHDTKGLAEVIVSKHRNGPTDTIKLAWLPDRTKFANIAGSSEIGDGGF
ncbi:MAG: replicative DNA helicase [Acidimicrobiales bacterium]